VATVKLFINNLNDGGKIILEIAGDDRTVNNRVLDRLGDF